MTFEPANQGNVYGNPGYTPPPPPRSGGNRTLWIVLGCGCLFVLLCSCLIGGSVLLGGGTFAALIGATQPAVEQSDRFLGALRDGNWQAAFDLCTSEFQRELGQPQRLQQFVTQGNRRPQT
ncbi:MAG: hypothetical protein NZ518_05805, partial [Dehalococcoidia bacterium]|nr:hypothetical protein [Dehalococcoidia bacterium]